MHSSRLPATLIIGGALYISGLFTRKIFVAMIYCPSINAYLEQYILIMRILSAVTLPVDCFGIYCILYQSCSQIKEYNHLLLMYQGLATALDSLLNLGFIPLANYTCAAEVIDTSFSLIFDRSKMMQLLYVASAEILFTIISCVIMIKLAYTALHQKEAISEKTKNMQKRFQRSLVLQIVIPFAVIALPAIIANFMIIHEYYEVQTIWTSLVAIISIHGMIGTLVSTSQNQCYRSFVLRLICKRMALVRVSNEEHAKSQRSYSTPQT
uniref:G protein-coupled receptor n=1 Tax=Heterorhabditis bacteriophora TaxID=37862 RepID=A0A1I7XFM6_HETBA